jgi:acetyltransferase
MNLEAFFSPRSVAIVGASRDETKVGHAVLRSVIRGDFGGEVFPVNPRAGEILGLKCYPDLKSIGKPPDLVVVCVPARLVSSVIGQCGAVRARAAIVITAGFKEVGPDGAKLERELAQAVRSAGIRMVGPNCLGIMVPGSRLNASFGGELPAAGSIGYISQSGALVAGILDMANAGGIGFSKLISIGNKADVDELDLLEALGADPQTRVIAGYLESIGDGNAFVREAEAISERKPILLMKSGGTEAGSAAASSHTGSLAGGDTPYECCFERAGIIRCDSIRSQFDFAQAFSEQPLPAGPCVAVITNAGGPGIMAADAVERRGLTFARLAPGTMETLAAGLPAAANVHNPVDVLGDALADRYELALKAVLADPGVDAIMVMLTPQAMTEGAEIARTVVRVTGAGAQKPVLACFLGAAKVAGAVSVLRDGRIPQYDSPEAAVAVLGAMNDYVRWRTRPKRVVRLFPVNRHKVELIVDRHLRRGEREVAENEAKEVLEAYGFATPKGAIATDPEQAAGIADQLGYPVVLKIWSPDILHKSDVGGVAVGLGSAREVMDGFDLMMYRIPGKAPGARILGVLVQEMCAKGREVILGMNRDPRFGPLMMFGTGGVMVEVLKDVAFCLAPLTAEEARQMLVSTRTYRMLTGVRGGEAVDIEAVAEGLQRLSQLVTEFPQIREMDINPYVVGPPGQTPVAVDARISVEKV